MMLLAGLILRARKQMRAIHFWWPSKHVYVWRQQQDKCTHKTKSPLVDTKSLGNKKWTGTVLLLRGRSQKQMEQNVAVEEVGAGQ